MNLPQEREGMRREVTRSYYDVIPGFDGDTPGIAQLDELKAFAKAEGMDWTDPRLQARWVLSQTQDAEA